MFPGYPAQNPAGALRATKSTPCGFVPSERALLHILKTGTDCGFFPLSLRERAGVRVFKKAQIMTACSIYLKYIFNVCID